MCECCNEMDVNEATTSNDNKQNKNEIISEIFTISEPLQGSSRNALGCLKEINDFELLERLGEGFFGMVYKVKICF